MAANDTDDPDVIQRSLFSSVDFQLSPELRKKAEEELQEKEEWRQRDIAALRDLVAGTTMHDCSISWIRYLFLKCLGAALTVCSFHACFL